VTDLPRFYQGEFGKLDFSHLNEMMKRLDILLPLVQSAAAGGGLKMETKSLLFPVYAKKASSDEQLLDDGDEGNPGNKYDWHEVTVVGDAAKWYSKTENPFGDDDDDEEEEDEAPATQLRSGSIEEETYGIVALDPSTGQTESGFLEGFALCMVVHKEASDDKPGGVAYLLFPFSGTSTGTTRMCMITDSNPGNASISVEGESRQCYAYAGKLLSEDLGSSEECQIIDLNGLAFSNKPTITGADTDLPYRAYDSGTIMLCNNISGNKWGFGHLPRFDVNCT